jgi:N-glycosylase/DNA lyase
MPAIVNARLHLRPGRVQPLGQALGALPLEVYVTLDRAEPEWPVLERLAKTNPSAAVLAGFALALSDFQLAAGGANEYWRQAMAALDTRGLPSTPDAVRDFMADVLSRPPSARLRTMKRGRIDRLLQSRLHDRLADRSFIELGQQSMALWHELGTAMNQAPQAKTIAFAMKIFDLLHKVATGAYVPFPARVPIVADLRIARVSFSSGLLEPQVGQSVAAAMAQGGTYASSNTGDIIDAWSQVSDAANGLSLFRIDSLIWQIAETIYRYSTDRTAVVQHLLGDLVRVGAQPKVASTLATELTWGM